MQHWNKSVVALAVTSSLMAMHANAQQATDTKDSKKANQQIETIEVRGFGATLGKSLIQKKTAESTVEIVSTDDLGSLPDVTIADALARLPGVAAERDRGNSSVLSIRGMGPRLNMATMGGREIVSAEPSREVRYEQFPSEQINSVEVYKSPMADQVEGGISGLVNMNFVNPLAKDKRIITVTGHAMQYPLGSDLDGADSSGKKGSVSYIDQWTDTFGVVLGLSYQDQPSVQRETSSWSYNKNAADQGDIDGDGKKEAAPWGGKTATKLGDNQRSGAMLILQWQPTDKLELKYDAFYSKFDITEREDQYWFDGWGNWGGGSNWNYNNSASKPQIITKADGTQQVTGGGLLWGNHSANNATWFQANDLFSTGLNTSYENDRWKVSTDIAYSEAAIESRWVNITSTYNGPKPLDVQWSTAGGRLGVMVNEDISKPEYYTLNGMTVDKDRDLTDEMVSGKVDFEYRLDAGMFDSLSFGARVADREKDNDVISWWQAPTNTKLTNYARSYVLGDGLVSPNMYGFNDWDQVAQDGFGGIDDRSKHTATDSDRINSWNVKEKTSAGYVMTRFNSELFGMSYSGNAGVRLLHTSSTSSGYQRKDNKYEPVSVDHSYTEVLPSLNLTFAYSDVTQIRVGLSRALSRPPLVEMRTGFDIDSQSPVKTASGGNPTLDPFIANQLDVGVEFYFDDDSALTTSVFFKDLKSHIGSSSDTLNLDGVNYAFTGPVNGEGGLIKGFEVMYQKAFNTLPSPLDGLGVYSNYSYTDSDVYEFVPKDNPLTLGGLSKHVGNFTLWYYKYNIDAKVSMNYRSSFTRVGSWDPTEITSIGAERTVDASIGYEITPQFKVMLQGQNLTNEASTSYFDNDPSRIGSYLDWGRRYLIGFSYSM